jgi:hypothetical protein
MVDNFMSDIRNVNDVRTVGIAHLNIVNKFEAQMKRKAKMSGKNEVDLCEAFLQNLPEAVATLKGFYEMETGVKAPDNLRDFCTAITALHNLKVHSLKSQFAQAIKAVKHLGEQTTITVPTDREATQIVLAKQFGNDKETAEEVLPVLGAATVVGNNLLSSYDGAFSYEGFDISPDTIDKIKSVVSNVDFSKIKDIQSAGNQIKQAGNQTIKDIEAQKKKEYFMKNCIWFALAAIIIFIIGAKVAKKM